MSDESQHNEDESLEARRERLRAQSERDTKMNRAEQWDPADGEVLEAEYLGSRVASNEYGSTDVYYFDPLDGDGAPKSVLGRTVMVSQMEQADPDAGDLVMVTFEGKQTAESARGEFYSYNVVSE